MVYWNCWSFGAGGMPTCPAATSWLCCWTALITSFGTSPNEYNFCGSIQIRIEYSPAPITVTLPTPGRRASSLTRLIVA